MAAQEADDSADAVALLAALVLVLRHHGGLRTAEPLVLRKGAPAHRRHSGNRHRRARGSRLVPLRLETPAGRSAGLRVARDRTAGQAAAVAGRLGRGGPQAGFDSAPGCGYTVADSVRSAGLSDHRQRRAHQHSRAQGAAHRQEHHDGGHPQARRSGASVWSAASSKWRRAAAFRSRRAARI